MRFAFTQLVISKKNLFSFTQHSTPSSRRPSRPPLRPNLDQIRVTSGWCCWSVVYLGSVGIHPTVWTLTPGQGGTHTPHSSQPAPGSWHHMAHSHIYYSSSSLPSTDISHTQPWCCCDPGVGTMLLFNTKRWLRKEQKECYRHISLIYFIRHLSWSTKVNRSCGVKSSAAEKWIYVEIARRTLASSILGQHAKRLEKLGHSK